MSEYREFLNRKHIRPGHDGIDVAPESLNHNLFDWQRLVVQWALRRGRAALFEATGLGKTLQELSWSEAAVNHTGKPVLILTPLAVAGQTVREAKKFDIGVPVVQCSNQSEVPTDGIAVTNYHKLHHFNPDAFGGVVLGEASILKSFMGKTKQELCSAFIRTPYRLTETATPAPNDYLEIGNQAQFLGVMDSNEMISRWFINDGAEVGRYRLKGHAATDFWNWVASWAVAVTRPSDLGYSDEGYILPPLTWHDVPVKAKLECEPGRLFDDSAITASTLQKNRKATIQDRCKVLKSIVTTDEKWLIWCHTDAEQDELERILPKGSFVSIRGSDSDDHKINGELSWREGSIQTLICKPVMFGHGLNWQHCQKMAFVGLTFSFEQIFQAVRRCWRFGQNSPVDVYAVTTDADGSILATIERKQRQYEEMSTELRKAFANQLHGTDGGQRDLAFDEYEAIPLPAWMHSKAS